MRLTLVLLCAFGASPLLQAGSTDTPPEVLAQGDALAHQLKTKEALQVFLEAEKKGANDCELLYRISREYDDLTNDTDSRDEKKHLAETGLDYAKRAVAADAKNANAHLCLAIGYGRLSSYLDDRTRLADARLIKTEAEEALRLDPKLDYADHVLGAWHYQIANLNFVTRAAAKLIAGGLPEASNEKAIEYFHQAIELAPQCVSHHVELGRAYIAMGKKDLAKAELEKGLALPSLEKGDDGVKQKARDALDKLNKKPANPIPVAHR